MTWPKKPSSPKSRSRRNETGNDNDGLTTDDTDYTDGNGDGDDVFDAGDTLAKSPRLAADGTSAYSRRSRDCRPPRDSHNRLLLERNPMIEYWTPYNPFVVNDPGARFPTASG